MQDLWVTISNVYVPTLQTDFGVVRFFRIHRGHKFASTVKAAPISEAFVAVAEERPSQMA